MGVAIGMIVGVRRFKEEHPLRERREKEIAKEKIQAKFFHDYKTLAF